MIRFYWLLFKAFTVKTRGVLSVVLITAAPSTIVRAQSTIQPTSIRSTRLRLLVPTSPGFDPIAKTRFSTPPLCCGTSYTQPEVIISNGTALGVRAVTLAWTLSGNGGKVTTFFTTLFPEPTGPLLLPGRRDLLTTNNYSLVTPFYHAETDLPELETVATRYQQTAPQNGLIDSLREATSVQVWIDAAIFSNGVILGPDKSALGKRFISEQQGAIDEAQSLLPLLSNKELMERALEADIVAAQAANSDETLKQNFARGREANRLRVLLNESGLGALRSALNQLASAHVAQLETYSVSRPH